MKSVRKPLFAVIAAMAMTIAAGLVLQGCDGKDAHAAEAPAPPEVDVATVLNKEITEWQSYSGRLQAIDHVEVRALVPGTIMAVYITDGALVKKGAALFLVDPRPYAAALKQARAQLEAAQVRSTQAQIDSARAKRLFEDDAIARSEYDTRANNVLEAGANVAAALAAVSTAQVNLGYTRILAPISGRVSRAEQTVGNVVAAGSGSAVLTTLVSVSPIYAAFDVDEQTYLRHMGQDSKTAVPVRLGLASEAGYARSGRVASVDNQLNTGSGTIRVRAIFDNADGALLPGLFARVAVGGGAPRPAILVDDRAVSTDQAKKFVLLVDAHNKVQYREVKLGEVREGLRVVDSGLAPGDRIVVNGLQRVAPGLAVTVKAVPMAGENPAT